MLVARNRLLMRLLLLISLLALSCIIVAHIIQEGCLKGTGQACGEDEIQVTSYAVANVTEVTEVADVTGVTFSGGRDAVRATSFRVNKARSVLIVAYQRTGSSLFGRVFNSNMDNVFYMFEPLDSIYSAMYGTSTGWNVPSDITNYANGSIRTIPEREITVVSETMRHMFSCDVDRLPTQFLFNQFFRGFPEDFSVLDQYTSCLNRFRLTENRCRASKFHIERFCGGRFGERSEETLTKCYQLLWNGKLDEESVFSKMRQTFSGFRTCMTRLRTRTDHKCSQIFRDVCMRRPIRVIKSVRATMDSAEPLLRRLPNLQVIHLVRDPRGVAVSRKNFHDGSVRGRFSEGAEDQLVREAQLYCQNVARDIRTRQRLEMLFPGRIYSVVYDDFVRDMVGHVRDIYRFIDIEIPNSTLTWARKAAMVGNRTATELASAWQQAVTFDTNEEIVRRCQDFFSLVGTKLPV